MFLWTQTHGRYSIGKWKEVHLISRFEEGQILEMMMVMMMTMTMMMVMMSEKRSSLKSSKQLGLCGIVAAGWV